MPSTPESISTLFNNQMETPHCRICYGQQNVLFKLCQCSGSIAFVHEQCILEWIEKRVQTSDECQINDQIPTPICEICKTSYSANIKLGTESICKQLLWDNLKKLSYFNTIFTINCLFVYLTVAYLLVEFIYCSFFEKQSFSLRLQNIFIQKMNLNQADMIKNILFGIVFPLYFFITSLLHLKRIKQIVIDGSKQIVADVTLIPKQIIKNKQNKSEL